MSLIVIIIILVLLFGGGGYYGYRGGYGPWSYSPFGLLIIILVILAVTGRL